MSKLMDYVESVAEKYESEEEDRELDTSRSENTLGIEAYQQINGKRVFMGKVVVSEARVLDGGTHIVVSDGSTSYFRNYLNRNGVKSR